MTNYREVIDESGSHSSNRICNHCKGEGKCDCYDCRFAFAYNKDFRNWRSSHEPRSGDALKWADSHSGEFVKCEKCMGTGKYIEEDEY